MILSLISAFLIFISLLIFKLIPGQKKKSQNLGICAALFLTIIFLSKIPFLYQIDQEAQFYTLNIPIGFLYGPALLVLRNSIEGKSKINPWLHLIPFLFFFTLYLLFASNLSFRFNSIFNYIPLLNSVLVLFHFLIYFTLINPRYFLSKQWKKAQLLPRLIVVSLVFSIFTLIILAFFYFTNNMEYIWSARLIMISLFLIALSSLSVSNNNEQNTENKIGETNKFIGIYHLNQFTSLKPTSELANSKLYQSYNRKVIEFINSLGYLDCDLTKEKFSTDLSIPIRHVSHFLKQVYGESYTSFINLLRLNYAESKLKEETMDHTIEDLASICGFSSRASFYRNFNAVYGCSPHKFRNDHHPNQ